MTRPTDDANSTDLLAGYALGDLSPAEEIRLRQVLAESPAQAHEATSYEEALALLPYGLPTAEPSARLKGKILQAASNASSIPERETPASNVIPLKRPSTPSSPQRRWQQWIPAISSGIAAVAVVALGLNQVQLGKQSQQTLALQQQLKATNRQLETLRSELSANQQVTALLEDPSIQVHSLVGEASGQTGDRLASARVLIKPGEPEVTLVAQNLPQLPEDQIYRFWAVTAASPTPQYCGQFRQDATGTAQWTAADTACVENPLQTMITRDAPDDPTSLPGPVVMESVS